MKLRDLFEEQRTIWGNVKVPSDTTSLEYEGVIVKGNFGCNDSAITSLKGSPSYVSGNFHCYHTGITSLEGAPAHVGENFDCSYTAVSSLHNVHKQIKYIGGNFTLPERRISHILGVMYIKGLKAIEFDFGIHHEEFMQVAQIINKHLKGTRNIHQVQEELLEAGYGDYAKL